MKKMLIAPALPWAAATLVLVGCSTDAQSGDGLFIDVPDVPMLEELGDAEGTLDIVAWSGFVEPEWADTFTEETGCVVNRRVAGTSDEMVTLMRTGEYDLVPASVPEPVAYIAFESPDQPRLHPQLRDTSLRHGVPNLRQRSTATATACRSAAGEILAVTTPSGSPGARD